MQQQQQHRRTKQNGFDFGVSIGGANNHNNPPPLAAAGSNQRRTQQQQQSLHHQPDLSSAIQAALRNGNFHVANRQLIALPWIEMFPKTDEEIEQELKEEEEKRKAKMFVGDGKPPIGNTFPRFGRRRLDHGVSLDMDAAKNQLKWWEGHPIVHLDCSSNNMQSLVDDFNDVSKKHDDRFVRLAEFLKLLQCSRNSISSLPSFQGFGILASLDISRNQLAGDLVFTLAFGTEKDQETQQQRRQLPPPPLLPSLVELNASYNRFTSVTGILQLLSNSLRILRLDHNQIERFSMMSVSNNNDNNSQRQQVIVSSLREVLQ
jgi:hypothetical protein